MTFCFVGIGSNEDPEYHCQQMIAALRERFGKVWVSSLKKTPAYGVEAADYINGVVCFEANIQEAELKRWCLRLENSLGRERGNISCVADLDILLLIAELPKIPTLFSFDGYYQRLFQELIEKIVLDEHIYR